MTTMPNKILYLGDIECNECSKEWTLFSKSVFGGDEGYYESPTRHEVYYVPGGMVLYSCPCHQDYMLLSDKTSGYIRKIWRLDDCTP